MRVCVCVPQSPKTGTRRELFDQKRRQAASTIIVTRFAMSFRRDVLTEWMLFPS